MPATEGGAFRFLQSAEFRLDDPLPGAPVAGDWRSRLALARRRAAQRVFDAAIRERVDFLLLAGGIVPQDPAGSSAPWWLAGEFERLGAAGIAIVLDEVDRRPLEWMDAHGLLPPNVALLDDHQPKIIQRQGRPVAAVIRAAGAAGRDDLFTLGSAPGVTQVPRARETAADYWAVGGEQPASRGRQFASGAPQGGPPAPGASAVGAPYAPAVDSVPHGALLTTIGASQSIETRLLPTDTFRWLHVEIPAPSGSTWESLRAAVRDRLARTIAGLTSEYAVVSLTLTWPGADWRAPQNRELAARLLAELREAPGDLERLWIDNLQVAPASGEPSPFAAAPPVCQAAFEALRRPQTSGGAPCMLIHEDEAAQGPRQRELSQASWDEYEHSVRPRAEVLATLHLWETAPPAAA